MKRYTRVYHHISDTRAQALTGKSGTVRARPSGRVCLPSFGLGYPVRHDLFGDYAATSFPLDQPNLTSYIQFVPFVFPLRQPRASVDTSVSSGIGHRELLTFTVGFRRSHCNAPRGTSSKIMKTLRCLIRLAFLFLPLSSPILPPTSRGSKLRNDTPAVDVHIPLLPGRLWHADLSPPA
jgi:hypothetical protein